VLKYLIIIGFLLKIASFNGSLGGVIDDHEHEVSQEVFEKQAKKLRSGSLSPTDSMLILKQFTLYFQNLSTDSLNHYAKLLHQLGVRYQETEAIAYGLLMQGFYHYLLGNFGEARAFYNRTMQVSTKNQYLEGKHLSLQYIGLVALGEGDFVEATAALQQSHLLAHELDEKDKLAYSFLNLGLLFLSQEYFKEAQNYNLKALKLFKELDYKMGQGYAYINLGYIVMEFSEDLDSAKNYLEKGYQVVKAALPNARVLVYSLNRLAGIYKELGNFEEAQRCIDEGWAIAEETKNKWGKNQLLTTGSEIDLAQKNYLGALEKAKTVYDVALDMGAKETQMHAAKTLAQVRGNLGDYEKAYFWHQKFTELNAIVFDNNKAREMGRLESILKIKEQEMENELLRQKALVLDETVKRQNMLLWGGAILVLAVMLIAYLLWRNNSEKKRANEQLQNLNEKIKNQNKAIDEQNEELKAANEQLLEMSNERETIMQMVVHDLKSPLNRIRGMMQIMKLENKGNLSIQNHGEEVGKILDDGIEFIQSLLDVNRLGIQETLHLKKTAVNDLLEDTVKGFDSVAGDKGIQLKLEKGDGPIDMVTEPDMLKRVLENLLSNAIKFSPLESEVHISLHQKQTCLIFSIKDCGPGISEKDKARIFRKFARLTARPTAGESSHGLGLYIVKAMTEKLGGEVEFNSQLGEGTEFRLIFPLQKQSASISQTQDSL